MKVADREQVRRMIDRNAATIVEVLDQKYFDKFHLPGAINVPLGDDFERRIQGAVPDKSAPVVVYCMDEECPASPTAGQRMEELGYQWVYDYEAGKMDWQDAGLPTESQDPG
jgi:rhodanese-related sulfurtransferase